MCGLMAVDHVNGGDDFFVPLAGSLRKNFRLESVMGDTGTKDLAKIVHACESHLSELHSVDIGLSSRTGIAAAMKLLELDPAVLIGGATSSVSSAVALLALAQNVTQVRDDARVCHVDAVITFAFVHFSGFIRRIIDDVGRPELVPLLHPYRPQ